MEVEEMEGWLWWRISYDLVVLGLGDAAAVATRTNQDFAFSNYDGNKNKTLGEKQWLGGMEHTVGARAHTTFVLTPQEELFLLILFFSRLSLNA